VGQFAKFRGIPRQIFNMAINFLRPLNPTKYCSICHQWVTATDRYSLSTK